MKYAMGLAAALCLASSGVAHSATYLSESVFDAAHPGSTTVDFEGLTSGSMPLPSPYTKDGLTFTGSGLLAVDTSFWGSLDSILNDDFAIPVTMTFSSVDAMGFYVGGGYGDGALTLSFFDGAAELFSTSPTVGGVLTAFTFFGVDDIGSFDRVVFTPRLDGFVSVGPVTFGTTTSAVPEPASWAIMLTGLMIAGAALRRGKVTARIAFG